jgi:hypothetical protein
MTRIVTVTYESYVSYILDVITGMWGQELASLWTKMPLHPYDPSYCTFEHPIHENNISKYFTNSMCISCNMQTHTALYETHCNRVYAHFWFPCCRQSTPFPFIPKVHHVVVGNKQPLHCTGNTHAACTNMLYFWYNKIMPPPPIQTYMQT